jgi:hypothetical protein
MAFDCVKWAELMQILEKTGNEWLRRRLVRKLYMNQSAEVGLDQGETRSTKIGRGLRN